MQRVSTKWASQTYSFNFVILLVVGLVVFGRLINRRLLAGLFWRKTCCTRPPDSGGLGCYVVRRMEGVWSTRGSRGPDVGSHARVLAKFTFHVLRGEFTRPLKSDSTSVAPDPLHGRSRPRSHCLVQRLLNCGWLQGG